MNKKTIKLLASWVLILSLVAGGRMLYVKVFPYYLSPQGEFKLGDGEYDKNEEVGEYFGKQVKSDFIAGVPEGVNVLGSKDSNVEKKIEVDLSSQTLYALEDGKRVAEFPVSTGKWDRTPTGTFQIWIKFRSKKMSGGSKELGTYYYLPNVPYIMFFYNDQVPKIDGYSLHGTYWHSNFGQVMSHGCVNMRTRDIEKLYQWAGPDTGGKSMTYANEGNLGTTVEIYGKAPSKF